MKYLLVCFIMANAYAEKPIVEREAFFGAQVEAVNYDLSNYSKSNGFGLTYDIDNMTDNLVWGLRFGLSKARVRVDNNIFNGNCGGFPHQCYPSPFPTFGQSNEASLRNRQLGLQGKYFLGDRRKHDKVTYYVGGSLLFNRLSLSLHNDSYNESYVSVAALAGIRYKLSYHWSIVIEAKGERNLGKSKPYNFRSLASIGGEIASGERNSIAIGLGHNF